MLEVKDHDTRLNGKSDIILTEEEKKISEAVQDQAKFRKKSPPSIPQCCKRVKERQTAANNFLNLLRRRRRARAHLPVAPNTALILSIKKPEREPASSPQEMTQTQRGHVAWQPTTLR